LIATIIANNKANPTIANGVGENELIASIISLSRWSRYSSMMTHDNQDLIFCKESFLFYKFFV